MTDKKKLLGSSAGATGNFPRGKFDESDEGELRVAITVDIKDKTVIVNFGKPVAWMGFDKAAALNFARILTEHANKL